MHRGSESLSIDLSEESSKKLAVVGDDKPSAATLSSNRHDHQHEPSTRYLWRPSFWRVRPLLGLLALALTIVCMLISLAILKASNGDATSKWYFQPTVYLAIATAVSNTALQCALAQAAPVSWWCKTLRGSTIKDLELDWEAGQSFPRAFRKSFQYRRKLSLLSIASLATTLVLADGPLLQRSSLVERSTITEKISLNIPLAPQLPPGFSVDVQDGRWAYTSAAAEVFTAHIKHAPIALSTHCKGTCRATVRGPGYAKVGCEKQVWSIDEAMLRDPNSTWGLGATPTQVMAQQPLIYSTAQPLWYYFCENGREPMQLVTGIANYHNCKGTFVVSNCTMLPAVLEYDIKIEGNIITYEPPAVIGSIGGIPDNYCHDPNPHRMTLATLGFVGLMVPFITANGSLGQWENLQPGQHPVEVPIGNSFNSFAMKYAEVQTGSNPCTCTTLDPRDDIIAAFNDLMFRSGVLLGSWENFTELVDSPFPVHQKVLADLSREENVYRSNIAWFLGAAAFQAVTILLILPAYWGWWNIGVELTLSPFHTGNVLNAPLLRGINSAAGSTGVVKAVGDTRVRLGTLNSAQDAVDEDGSRQEVARCRLEIAEPHRVVMPLKSERFTD